MAERTTRSALVGRGAVVRGGALAPAKVAPVVDELPFGPTFTGGRFALEIDRSQAGWISACDGGNASGEIVVEKLGGDLIQKKHIGNVKYENVVLEQGVGMSKGFYQWLQPAFDSGQKPLGGSVVGYDEQLNAKAAGNFFNALITEVSVPALDADKKGSVVFSATVTPETTSVTPRDGKPPIGPPPPTPAVAWRLDLDGVDTRKVSKIDSFTVKQSIASDSVDVPNLVVTFPEVVDSMFAWHEDFVIKGNNGDDKERSGALVFLDDKGLEYARISLSHVGPVSLTPVREVVAGATVRRIKCEMYCEDMSFKFGDASWA